MQRMNINVSAIDYDKSSSVIKSALSRLEEMVHEEDGFIITDSEFAFGWHFYVVCVNLNLIQKLADQMGSDFEKLKGKSMEKKFLTWLTERTQQNGTRMKLAIKEEMESSKYGIF
jgi:hypothetical protein